MSVSSTRSLPTPKRPVAPPPEVCLAGRGRADHRPARKRREKHGLPGVSGTGACSAAGSSPTVPTACASPPAADRPPPLPSDPTRSGPPIRTHNAGGVRSGRRLRPAAGVDHPDRGLADPPPARGGREVDRTDQGDPRPGRAREPDRLQPRRLRAPRRQRADRTRILRHWREVTKSRECDPVVGFVGAAGRDEIRDPRPSPLAHTPAGRPTTRIRRQHPSLSEPRLRVYRRATRPGSR